MVQKLSIDVDLECATSNVSLNQLMSSIVKIVFEHFAPGQVTTIPASVLNGITDISFAQTLKTALDRTVELSPSLIKHVHLDLSAALGANKYGWLRIMSSFLIENTNINCKQ
jgi:hypothetical protein